MAVSRLPRQQRDRSRYSWPSIMAPPSISHDRRRPLVTLGRKGYQGRSPWLVGPTLGQVRNP
jgi:hypothetical protein